MKFGKVAILTGAGISAESGIPVFRSEDGLWEKHRIEDVATYTGFLSDKTLVHNFYNGMRTKIKSIGPNKAHEAITTLQQGLKEKGGWAKVITQNIDDLHEKAHNTDIIHMHGELNSLLCESCHHTIPFDGESSIETVCPHCHKKTMRPDIVWFGEQPYYLDEITNILYECDLFITIGTSGVVYPAAGFVSVVRQLGKPCVEFNLEPTLQKTQFTKGFYGKATETLPKFVENLLKNDEF